MGTDIKKNGINMIYIFRKAEIREVFFAKKKHLGNNQSLKFV